MNREEARQVLLLYRPGTSDAEDPQVETAMALAREDPELGRWFTEHAAFQQAMRRKFRQIEVPSYRKSELLLRKKLVLSPTRHPSPVPVWLAAAAAIFVLAVGFMALRTKSGQSVQFAHFKERMVSEVQRQYAMDWETSDGGRLRAAIAGRGGLSDYEVPRSLERLKLTGGGVLKWQSNPVSMLCYDRGGGKMLYLFVVKRDAVKDPPPAQQPQLAVIHQLMTASWTRGENSYVLAGEEKEKDLQSFARAYLN